MFWRGNAVMRGAVLVELRKYAKTAFVQFKFVTLVACIRHAPKTSRFGCRKTMQLFMKTICMSL
jgi:hypothetical protein